MEVKIPATPQGRLRAVNEGQIYTFPIRTSQSMGLDLCLFTSWMCTFACFFILAVGGFIPYPGASQYLAILPYTPVSLGVAIIFTLWRYWYLQKTCLLVGPDGIMLTHFWFGSEFYAWADFTGIIKKRVAYDPDDFIM